MRTKKNMRLNIRRAYCLYHYLSYHQTPSLQEVNMGRDSPVILPKQGIFHQSINHHVTHITVYKVYHVYINTDICIYIYIYIYIYIFSIV